jgi:hypothetical protein
MWIIGIVLLVAIGGYFAYKQLMPAAPPTGA